jgi:hypothetical protein
MISVNIFIMSIVVSVVYVFSWDMIVDIQCYFYIDCDAGSMLDKGGDLSCLY